MLAALLGRVEDFLASIGWAFGLSLAWSTIVNNRYAPEINSMTRPDSFFPEKCHVRKKMREQFKNIKELHWDHKRLRATIG